jgi:hypothetical protein
MFNKERVYDEILKASLTIQGNADATRVANTWPKKALALHPQDTEQLLKQKNGKIMFKSDHAGFIMWCQFTYSMDHVSGLGFNIDAVEFHIHSGGIFNPGILASAFLLQKNAIGTAVYNPLTWEIIEKELEYVLNEKLKKMICIVGDPEWLPVPGTNNITDPTYSALVNKAKPLANDASFIGSIFELEHQLK